MLRDAIGLTGRGRRRTAAVAAGTAAALALAGCGSGSPTGGLAVRAAYIPQPVSDSLAAGFLTIVNEGGETAELTSVSSDIARKVTVHETVGGSMREMGRADVPAHGRLVLKSGGTHLMFEELKRRPKEGETVSVELRFAGAEPLRVEMPVKPATYAPKTGH
jgi:periplasmic copper chaperone A